MWTQCTLYQYTNKTVCVLCCRILHTEQHSIHPYHEPNKKKCKSGVTYLSNTDIYIIVWGLPSGSNCPVFLQKLCTPSFITICMLHDMSFYFPLYDYVNNTRWTVTDTKLTTGSPASLYSYLHLTPNILLITLLSQNPQSLFFPWHKTPNFTPTQNDKNNVTCAYQYMQHSELNGSKYCLNLLRSVLIAV